MTETRTLTLSEFLLARIAEDEAAARLPLELDERFPLPDVRYDKWVRQSGASHSFVSGAPSPARVLAECAAKRGAIEAAWADHVQIEGEWGSNQGREQMGAKDDNPAAVEWLALPYADHPDYRQEWRP